MFEAIASIDSRNCPKITGSNRWSRVECCWNFLTRVKCWCCFCFGTNRDIFFCPIELFEIVCKSIYKSCLIIRNYVICVYMPIENTVLTELNKLKRMPTVDDTYMHLYGDNGHSFIFFHVFTFFLVLSFVHAYTLNRSVREEKKHTKEFNRNDIFQRFMSFFVLCWRRKEKKNVGIAYRFCFHFCAFFLSLNYLWI